MKRAAFLVMMAAWLLLPAIHARADSASAMSIKASKLRLAPEVFAPATLQIDAVADNAEASSSYIGSHHAAGYQYSGRITGYYERAGFKGLVYARYLASVYPTAHAAYNTLLSSVNYIAVNFGGSIACQGDEDGVSAKGDVPVDDDNSSGLDKSGTEDGDDDDLVYSIVGDEFGQFDQDESCTGVDSGVAPIVTPAGGIFTFSCTGPNNLNCTATGTGPVAPVAPNTNTTVVVIVPEGNPVQTITPSDCSGAVGSPCYLLNFGYSTATDDRAWGEAFVAFQIGPCLAEITVTSRPRETGTINPASLINAAATTLRAACTPAPSSKP